MHLETEDEPGTVETGYYTFAGPDRNISLASGREFGPITVAYETYGRLNIKKDNAVLILHALSGDAHAAGWHKGHRKPGWWHSMIGPGRAFDTDSYYIICSNVLGGCMGTTGPSSRKPGSKERYALDFPLITIKDMVDVQRHLLDHLGIERLLSVAGGSMGGMQALQWVSSYPERILSAIPIATGLKHSPQQIAFNEVGRQAIMSDPAWNNGGYYGTGQPERGLALARMIGHITYMSNKSMEDKFSRKLKNGDYNYSFNPDFEVESYLHYKGGDFVKRFDANTYLYITKAIDYFDMSGDGSLIPYGRKPDISFLVISFSSDWLYPPYQSRQIVRRLKERGMDTTYCEIDSGYGHDAFLLEAGEQDHLVKHFLRKVYAEKS
jgi:homoserine O-acetyltransferase/O-succinyltransferase